MHSVAHYAPWLANRFINLGLSNAVYTTCYYNYTPLMVAIKYHQKAYTDFIDAPTLNHRNLNGLTALEYAQREKREQWIVALEKYVSLTKHGQPN